ncbi:hypothetical protein V8G54_027054 [Vigna mungo]|uniref:Uncharacterized protein n=1 Tax=Vigna mungo TaxID=3915 RepID=A0AAQ3N1P8_VIGMU
MSSTYHPQSDGQTEDLNEFQQAYLYFHLEKNVATKGKCIVTSEVDDAGKAVARRGHVDKEPPRRDTSKSLRSHMENVLLKNFVRDVFASETKNVSLILRVKEFGEKLRIRVEVGNNDANR